MIPVLIFAVVIYVYLVADLDPHELRLVEVGFVLLYAAWWLWEGSSLLPVIAWLIPLLALHAFDPVARGTPVAVSIGWGIVRGTAWLGVWAIYCTPRGSRLWERLSRAIAKQVFLVSAPRADRRFYRAFVRTFDPFRLPKHAPRPSREKTMDLLRTHIAELERLDPPTREWGRVRTAAIAAAQAQLQWLVRRARTADDSARAAVDARTDAITDAMCARSAVFRALIWQPVPRP